MKKNKLDIFVTTILFMLILCIMKNILLDQDRIVPVLYEGLFFFIAYGLWKTLSFTQDSANPYYCL